MLYNAGEVMAVRMLRRKPQPSLLLRARTAALGLLAGLAVLLTGCFPLLPAVTGDPPETGGATGQLLITVHAAGLTAETFHRPLETLRVTLTKPRGSTGSAHAPALRREAPFSAGGSTVEFQAIETGLWKVTAEILDAEGVPAYGGAGEVLVRDRETAAAQITALPLPGQLEVRIDLGEQCIEVSEAGACLADLADRGHVRFLPTASMNPASRSFDWPEQARSAVITVQDVPFGDIEYQLVFYRGGTNLGNTLYASQWYPVRIEPGRTSSVEWSPTFGSSTVEVSIQHPPPPPEDLAAEWTENGLLLTWAAPDAPDAAGYNVWRKTGPLTPLERLAQVAGGHVTSWLHEAAAPEQCTSPGNDGLFYFVTAVSEAGLESLWSPPVDACALL